MTVQDSVYALLVAATDFTVYDAEVPELPEFQYHAYWPTAGSRTSSNVASTSSDGVFRFMLTSVASHNPAAPGNLRRQVSGMAQQVRDRILGQIAAAPGWVCGPIEQDDLDPFIRDDNSIPGRLTVVASVSYHLMADRI